MIGTIFYNIAIKPLEYVIESVFMVFFRLFSQPILAIAGVSLVVGLLTLPLYKRADEIQEAERQKQSSMEKWVQHIKKTFKGDERYFMLTTYYRQQGYKPIYALKSSISLLLQIPFFTAAYAFLSDCSVLNNASFFVFKDLGSPDQLLHLGKLAINIMPVVMTLLNLVSCWIYTKGLKLKDKIQPVLLAVVFLVLLYNSPSGLVIYWTFNQLFSIFKLLFMKVIKNPKKIINISCAVLGVSAASFLLLSGKYSSKHEIIFCVELYFVSFVPLLFSLIKKHLPARTTEIKDYPKFWKHVIISEAVLFVLMGLVIPLSVISDSPIDFVSSYGGAADLIINTVSVYVGFIFCWLNVFIAFAPKKHQNMIVWLLTSFVLIAIIDFMFFSKGLGIISTSFVYENNPVFTTKKILLNVFVVLIVLIADKLALKYINKAIIPAYAILAISLLFLSVVNIYKTNKAISEEKDVLEQDINAELPDKIFHFSKTGKNVVVFMLDRAVGPFIPYIFNERPILKEQFDGFTYYSNTLSYGKYTIHGAPGLFGGYEYTPLEMNKRDDSSLREKHNEALKLLPTLFSENGYEVTVVDPPYANYSSDLSIFDNIDHVSAYKVSESLSGALIEQYSDKIKESQYRNCIFFSIIKTIPLALHNYVYYHGSYLASETLSSEDLAFLKHYSTLNSIIDLTDTSCSTNNFIIVDNETPHRPTYLYYPSYTLSSDSESKDFIGNHPERFEVNGIKLTMSSEKQLQHYDVLMASILKIGQWLDYLKDEGVYDNTRIIIVSDHGYQLKQFKKILPEIDTDPEYYLSLLMVKDFDEHGFRESTEFTTNADTPYFAVADLINNPVNPFTYKSFEESFELRNTPIVYQTKIHAPNKNANVFEDVQDSWYYVHDNVWDKNNWEYLGTDYRKVIEMGY